MRLDHLAHRLNPDLEQPLALQVARVLGEAIGRGELRPGEALPGTRALAEALGVSRYAILGALRELELEGFLEVRQGSGSTVAPRPPDLTPRAWGPRDTQKEEAPETPAFAISSRLSPISTLGPVDFDLAEAHPDARLAPQEALAKAYQRAIRRHGDDLLGPGEPKGNLALRRELAAFLRTHRGLRLDPEQLLITRGTRQALQLLTEALCSREGRLAVESPGSPALLEALRAKAGPMLTPLPTDAGGLRTDALEAVPAADMPRALLLQPLAQMPTGTNLDPPRRAALLAFAADRRMAILEEDSGYPFCGLDPAPLPLAAEDRKGVVVYLLSLSRLLAPGLRLGLLAGPRDLVDRLARLRRSSEQQGDRVLEWAMGDLVRDGDLERALRRNARLYAERSRCIEEGLAAILGPRFRVQGRSGLGLWLQAAPGHLPATFAEAAALRGVKLRTFGEEGLWIGTATVEEARVPELLDRLRTAWAQL